MFGIGCYVIYFSILWVGFGTVHQIAALDHQLTLAEMQRIHINDIAGALTVLVVLGILWSGSTNHKLFLRVMQRIGITKKFGNENVWDFTLNSNIPSVEYAYVRDFQKKIVYSGWIKAFSEGVARRELLMEAVEVFDLDTTQKIFETPLMYMSFSDDNFNMEFPYRDPSSGVQR